MRCRLFTFTMSLALINYIRGRPLYDIDLRSNVHDYHLSDEYTSGDNANLPKTLAGLEKQLNRSLVTGDTFTPQEMLPIAEKLLGKVESPGFGKGFVSSTKGPKELADKLFEAFFFDTKRIVTLKDHDIIGLDALQALALEGETADKSVQAEDVTEATQKMYLRGQIIDIKKSRPLKSHYKLVTKVVPQTINKQVTKGKRRGIPLSKKLPPMRHLIVNGRSHLRKGTEKKYTKYNKKVTPRERIIKKHMESISKPAKKTVNEVNLEEKKKANCHWKYVCSTPGNLDTCSLHTTCGNETNSPVTPAQKQDDKREMLMNEFRRMVGITVVDEEVEKILEVRHAQKHPNNLGAIERVESLAEFFNNIIVRENMESTTSTFEDHLLKGTGLPLSDLTKPNI